MNIQDLNSDQKKAYNEMAQLLMDKLNISSEEASKKIQSLFEGMNESLEEGILQDDVARFEEGSIYQMGFIGGSDLKVDFICVKRTPKTVTFEKFKGAETVKRKIKQRSGAEYVEYGNYSMAPTIRADRCVG